MCAGCQKLSIQVLYDNNIHARYVLGSFHYSSIFCHHEQGTCGLLHFSTAAFTFSSSSVSAFSFFGIRLTIFFSEVGGCAALPFTVPGENAALPLGPLVLGILEIPEPVPLDSAVVRLPAIGSRPCGWNRVDCIARTARFMTSGLRGVAKTVGRSTLPTGLPSRLKILADFLVIGFHRLSSLGRFERYVC